MESDKYFHVTLIGTGSPAPRLNRFGPCTLIEAGGEKFLFDTGRGAMQRLFQLNIPFKEITGVFFTHLHSDHVVGFPDLWLTGWIGQQWGGRTVPLPVWGPKGTQAMMSHLQKAYQFDINVRTHYPREGVSIRTQEFQEGPVYEANGLKVTAFLVDHGQVKPAYGYRIDFGGYSVVLSGDTRYNQNLIRYATGVNLLVHEVVGMSDEFIRNSRSALNIQNNHTTPQQAGKVFSGARPTLPVFNHILLFGGLSETDIVAETRKAYNGPLIVGEDLMKFVVGKEIQVSDLVKQEPIIVEQ